MARWTVSNESDDVVVSPTPAAYASRQAHGNVVNKPFAGGHLHAENRGEFGGGLWWIPESEPSRQQLLREPVVSIEEEEDGSLLVFTGILHMDVDQGRVYRLRSTPAPLSPVLLGSLDGFPLAVGRDARSLLAVTTRSVWSVGGNEPMNQLAVVDLRRLGATSVLRSVDGSLYVGLTAFVLRLVPHAGGMHPEWLVPQHCAPEHFARCECFE